MYSKTTFGYHFLLLCTCVPVPRVLDNALPLKPLVSCATPQEMKKAKKEAKRARKEKKRMEREKGSGPGDNDSSSDSGSGSDSEDDGKKPEAQEEQHVAGDDRHKRLALFPFPVCSVPLAFMPSSAFVPPVPILYTRGARRW